MQHIAKNPSKACDPKLGVYWISQCGKRLHFRDGWTGNEGLAFEAETITKGTSLKECKHCQRIAYG